MLIDESVLDDVARLEAGDPAEMLRAVASSAAQSREAALAATDAGVARLAEDGRPRAVVVLGMGGSAIAGDVLAAVCGPACPVPVVTHRGYDLPGWVGGLDLVVAVSCSGGTEETLSATDEAIRRGARLLTVGGADSPLAERAGQVRAPHVVVAPGRQPRASLWALAVPLVVAAHHLGLTHAPPAVLESTAERLAATAERCRPSSESFLNPGKSLALELAGSLPMVWGTPPVGGVAAYRLVCQLAENAKYPALWGALPEANHNQVVAFDGAFGAAAQGTTADELFRDRVDDPAGSDGASATRLRLVLLRDTDEHPRVALRAAASKELAARRGIAVTELVAEGSSALERLAGLVVLGDYASVYLALLLGVDPTPVACITALKDQLTEHVAQ